MTIIADVFLKLETAKDVVKQLSQEPRFRTPSESEHVKGSQILVKSEWEHFCPRFFSTLEDFELKMSL